MSRKDPRRALFVPLDADGVSALRTMSRGRSLGDSVRRLAVAHAGPVPSAPDAPVRKLPVQLPRRLRRAIEDRAGEAGRAPGDLLAGIVVGAAIGRDPEESE